MSCEDNTVYCYCEHGPDAKHERTDLCAVVERHVEEPEFEEPEVERHVEEPVHEHVHQEPVHEEPEVEEPSHEHVHQEPVHEEPVRSRHNSKASCHAEPVVQTVVEPVAEPEHHHCHKENNHEHHNGHSGHINHHHKSHHHHNGEHHHKSHHSHENHDDKPKNVGPLVQPDFTQQQQPVKKDVDENDWAAKNQGRGKIKNLISMFDNGAVLNDKLGNSTSAYKTDYGVGQGKKIRQDVFH